MNKEQAIKEAWGEYYDKIKNELDEHGRYNYYDTISIKRKSKLWQFENIDTRQLPKSYLLMPTSIVGIENNNGWIKIESEDDLPNFSDDVFYNLHDIDNKETVYYKNYDDLEFMWKKGIITHYKQITEEKPPIY